MSNDLVKRLRDKAITSNDGFLRGVALEAADRIEQLEAENKRLRERIKEWYKKGAFTRGSQSYESFGRFMVRQLCLVARTINQRGENNSGAALQEQRPMSDDLESKQAKAAARIEVLEAKLEKLERWQAAAFIVHGNLDLDIEANPEALAELKGGDDGQDA